MLKLYFVFNLCVGWIVWFLEELGFEYEINKMVFYLKDLKFDEYRVWYFLGCILVFEDGDVMIYELGVIVEYVLECYKNGGLKFVVDVFEYFFYFQWFYYCEGMVMFLVNIIVVQMILLLFE